MQDDFAALRAEAEWRIPHVRDELNAAITRLEEQLEAAQKALRKIESHRLRPVDHPLGAYAEVVEIARDALASNPACSHVWKPLLDGNEYACINCGAFRSRGVDSPASERERA